MPTYQYTCTACGEPVEAVQKFSDAPLTVCSACGGRLRKVFSAVGIVFKGSGFYRTDSRKNGSAVADAGTKDKPSADSASATSPASSESGSGGSASADKPAAKKSPETVSASSRSTSSSSSEKVA